MKQQSSKLTDIIMRTIIAAVGVGLILLGAVVPGPSWLKGAIVAAGIILVLFVFPYVW